MRRNLAMAISVTLAAVVAPAQASFVNVGEPIPDNSWLQEFTSDTPGFVFDEFQFLILSDDAFAPDPLQDFTRPDWSVLEVNARHTAVLAGGSPIDGPAGETLGFYAHFEGDYEADPLTFVWVMYENEAWRSAGQATWTGNVWFFTSSGWDPGSLREGQPVPEPAALLLSGLGLALMGGSAARRRRSAQTEDENGA